MARQRPFKAKGSASGGSKPPKRRSQTAKPAKRLSGPKLGSRPRPYSSVAGKNSASGSKTRSPKRKTQDAAIIETPVQAAQGAPKPAKPRKPREGGRQETGKAERLQKVLAQAGLGSRRACEDLIVQGRVTINGEIVRELGTKVDPGAGRVAVDGEPIKLETTVYYAVNKPKGYVSTNDDPSGRPRVLDLLPEVPERVYTVGRLDEDSTGLILLTNDGELANRLAHPKFGVEKMYRALVAGLPEPETLHKLTEGIWLSDGKMRAQRVRIVGRQGQSTTLELVLAEGKKREIRRMLAKLGHKVMSLSRIAVGPISLKGLPIGECRPLTKHEIELLHKVASGQAVSLPHFAEGEPTTGQHRGRDRVRERRTSQDSSAPKAQPEPRQERGPGGAPQGRDPSRRDQRPEGRSRDDRPRDRDRSPGDRKPSERVRDDRHRDRAPAGETSGPPEVRREYRRADGRIRDDRHRERGPSNRPQRDRKPYGRGGEDRPKYPPRQGRHESSGDRPPRTTRSREDERPERPGSDGPRPPRRDADNGPHSPRPGPSGQRPYRRDNDDSRGHRAASGGPEPYRRPNAEEQGGREGSGGPRPYQARTRRPDGPGDQTSGNGPRGNRPGGNTGGPPARGGSDRPNGRDRGARPGGPPPSQTPRRRIIGLEPEHLNGGDGGNEKKRPPALKKRFPGSEKGEKLVKRSNRKKSGDEPGDV
jgi:23S rRNA pseudouridine2605 synthase